MTILFQFLVPQQKTRKEQRQRPSMDRWQKKYLVSQQFCIFHTRPPYVPMSTFPNKIGPLQLQTLQKKKNLII